MSFRIVAFFFLCISLSASNMAHSQTLSEEGELRDASPPFQVAIRAVLAQLAEWNAIQELVGKLFVG